MQVFHQRPGWELSELCRNGTFDVGTAVMAGYAVEITLERGGELIVINLTAEEMRTLSRIPGDWRKA